MGKRPVVRDKPSDDNGYIWGHSSRLWENQMTLFAVQLGESP